ncbi:hypothetical protein, partial [Dietzia kunjamensis]|uniref:hypothetical protein n=1 Tax=Dietzia kunjamensis TaxID=322509 RepID=UPI0039BFF5CB
MPYVDPQMGGVEATVLALLDNPSTKSEAGTGSGLLSLENDDRTARLCAEKYNEYGLTPGEVVHWNVAPAPIAGIKNGASTGEERARGALWLRELLSLLSNLRVILLMGDNARDGWKLSGLAPAGILIPAEVPHPSGRGMGNRDAKLRLHRGLVETMTELHGPDLVFPPEPADSGQPSPRPAKQPRQAAKKAALTPQPPVTFSDAPLLSDGQLWGWWPSFEHYSSTGSNPWGTSRSIARLEAAIDRYALPPRKKGAIARLGSAGWLLEAKRGNNGQTIEMTSDQATKYFSARNGGSWGNQGKVPPAAELTRSIEDLWAVSRNVDSSSVIF